METGVITVLKSGDGVMEYLYVLVNRAYLFEASGGIAVDPEPVFVSGVVRPSDLEINPRLFISECEVVRAAPVTVRPGNRSS